MPLNGTTSRIYSGRELHNESGELTSDFQLPQAVTDAFGPLFGVLAQSRQDLDTVPARALNNGASADVRTRKAANHFDVK